MFWSGEDVPNRSKQYTAIQLNIAIQKYCLVIIWWLIVRDCLSFVGARPCLLQIYWTQHLCAQFVRLFFLFFLLHYYLWILSSGFVPVLFEYLKSTGRLFFKRFTCVTQRKAFIEFGEMCKIFWIFGDFFFVRNDSPTHYFVYS